MLQRKDKMKNQLNFKDYKITEQTLERMGKDVERNHLSMGVGTKFFQSKEV